ncbi:MAG: hypothetical protein JRG86_10050 [Deltaproteobacteria bacterium]|nr:hypothetical protein [Deltaproteobacteria bacterium]MBW2500017.1 hypothetical protein [Deltaproteobacteria bacterium]
MMTEPRSIPVGGTADFSGLEAEAVRVPHVVSIGDHAVAKGELVGRLGHLREVSLGLPLERLVAGRGN